MSILWEVIISAILSKRNCICRCVLFGTFSEIKIFHCAVPKLLIRERYCLLFQYRYLLFKWQTWYSLPSIIHFRKFHSQPQCTLQILWEPGVLLVCTEYSVLHSEIYVALSRKPFGIEHMNIYTVLLRMTDTLTPWDTLCRGGDMWGTGRDSSESGLDWRAGSHEEMMDFRFSVKDRKFPE
jgi:hypothetical protein